MLRFKFRKDLSSPLFLYLVILDEAQPIGKEAQAGSDSLLSVDNNCFFFAIRRCTPLDVHLRYRQSAKY
ncbi:hypothetical protein AMK34_11320 [Amycolatopsis sp. CB00013]|nr:hypothetical protein AMK34_11320 [Amycolatopsis sp. CB00013]